MGFGDSSLNFRLNIWSATFEDFFALRSEVNVLVNERLKAEGIEIPFPQRDLHLRSVAPGVRGETDERGALDSAEATESSLTPDSSGAADDPTD
jgi:small-conductance mechanosensitive channel